MARRLGLPKGGLPKRGQPAGREDGVVAITAVPATLRGHLDLADRARLRGWALAADPDAPAGLQVLDNGRPIARILANLHRPDLEASGIGTGRHGFDLLIPGGLSPLVRHVVQVRREADGSELEGSPAIIEASDGFDAGLERAVALAVAGVDDAGTRTRALAFLAAQRDVLLQQAADAESQVVAREAHRRQRRLAGPRAVAGKLAGGAAGGEIGAPPPKRALVIDERLPVAGRDAGSEAILSHMRALQDLGYAVSLVAADELGGDGSALGAMAITVCGAPHMASVEEVLRRQADGFDLVYLHRASIAGRYMALVRRYQERARILYSVADLHHVRLERQAVSEDRPELVASARAMRLVECTASWQADAVLTHSLDEAALLRRMVPEARVHRVLWDMPSMQGRAGAAASIGFAGRHGVGFIGHYAHEPNQDAVRWLLDEIMPLVWASDPAVPLLLAGADLPDALRDRVAASAGPVEWLGRVADLPALLGRMRLTVAPLRFGAGVKGKVLDSLGAGVPCAGTAVAWEGIVAPDAWRTDLALCVVQGGAGEAARLAAAILRLHGNAPAWAATASAGRRVMQSLCAPSHISAALLAAIEGRPAVDGLLPDRAQGP